MTTYKSPDEIYDRVLGDLLHGPVKKLEAVVLNEVRDIRRQARQSRAQAREPGFSEPYVSYIPAYGAETEIRAMLDYCRLRRMADKSELFLLWLSGLVAFKSHGSIGGLRLCPANIPPYQEETGEEYMSQAQLQHFRTILKSWKRDLLVDTARQEVFLRVHNQLRSDESSGSRGGSVSEPGIAAGRSIRRIDEALSRINDGSYGYCVESGKPIGIKRLEANPVATMCIEVQERHARSEKKDLIDRLLDDMQSKQD